MKKRTFTASSAGALFHRESSGCGIAKRIPRASLLKFKTFDDAVEADKRPCACVAPKTPRLRKKSKKRELKPGVDVVKGPATARTHTAGGRFAPGNPGGPGIPCFKNIRQTRKALSQALQSFDPEHVFEVLKAMYVIATGGGQGSIQAAKLLLEYLLGKPTVTLLLKSEGTMRDRLIEMLQQDAPSAAPPVGLTRDIDVEVVPGRVR